VKIYPAVREVVNLLSAPGYKKDIGRQVREEIRRYYAQDNRLLEEQLRRATEEGSRAAATGSQNARLELESEIRNQA